LAHNQLMRMRATSIMPSAFGAALFGVAVLGVGCGGALQAPPAGSGEPSAHDFVIQHRPELEKEISVGSGPQIYELSKLVHCQDIAELGRVLHRKSGEIFPSPPLSDAEVADRVVAIMTERRELRCRDLETGPTRPFAAGRHYVGPEHPG
jgi:hypothetical protein